MQYFEKTYSAIRYAAVTILLLGIGVICSTLFAHPTVEDNTGKNVTEVAVTQTDLGARYLSEVSGVGKTFANRSHGADQLPFSSLHFFTPEIDELDKIALSLIVDTHKDSWNIRPTAIGCQSPFSVSSDAKDKILSLLETVVLLN